MKWTMDALGLLMLLVVGRCYNLLLAQAPLVLIHFLSASFHQILIKLGSSSSG
jgi:hypothetical protein